MRHSCQIIEVAPMFHVSEGNPDVRPYSLKPTNSDPNRY